MAILRTNRGLQYPLVAEFVFNFDDTMVNTAGNLVDFGAANLGGAAGSFDVIHLPPSAIVIGGDISTDIAFDTAGFDVIVGDSATANRYHATADLKALGRVPLLTPGYVGLGESIRLNFTSDDVCTTGRMSLRVHYIIRGRTNESQTS
jgi:hypothetical protein